MQYREFINGRELTSLLGYGLMRLPLNSEKSGDIDYEMSSELLDYAIENGINYLDTAYVYHDGQSEVFLGDYLSKRDDREKLYIATKLPVHHAKDRAGLYDIFNTQLERLKTDYIDFYLLHALNAERWKMCKELNIFEFVRELKKEGKIKYIGFSFHDELEVFKEIVDSGEFDFCQIQYNYLDEHYQAGIEGLNYAKSKGLDVVIMEPLKGGRLANLPNDIVEPFQNVDQNISNARWAMKWLMNQGDVSVILSGMNEREQITDNIVATATFPNSLNQLELDAIQKVKDNLNSRIKVDCTSCEYCLPCPSGVAIPTIFSYYNNIYVFDELEKSRHTYSKLVQANSDATQCIECGECESECPQQLQIIDSLKDAHTNLI